MNKLYLLTSYGQVAEDPWGCALAAPKAPLELAAAPLRLEEEPLEGSEPIKKSCFRLARSSARAFRRGESHAPQARGGCGRSSG